MDAAARLHYRTPLGVRMHWQGQDATVELDGELDCFTAPVLAAELARALPRKPARLVLDLSRLAFMDCAGVSVIVRARRMLPGDRPIVLKSPSRTVRKVLEITHMDHVCQISAAAAAPL